MKEISPSEREILERISTIVPVYERMKQDKKKPISGFELGCFDCNHTIPSMAASGTYCTISIRGPQTVSFVVCFADKFYQYDHPKEKHWLQRYTKEFRQELQWPHVGPYWLWAGEARENPEIYVRLLFRHGVDQVPQHINKRVNLLELLGFPEDDEANMVGGWDLLIACTSGRSRGVYAEPIADLTLLFNNANEPPALDHRVPTELIKLSYFATDLRRKLTREYGDVGGPLLQPIRQASVKKKVRLIEPQPVDYTADAWLTAAVNDIQMPTWTTVQQFTDNTAPTNTENQEF